MLRANFNYLCIVHCSISEVIIFNHVIGDNPYAQILHEKAIFPMMS